jgi:hypothetical protein
VPAVRNENPHNKMGKIYTIYVVEGMPNCKDIRNNMKIKNDAVRGFT